MNWLLLAQINVGLFFIVGGYAVIRRRPLFLLCLTPFALALGGFNVYALGTIWFPIKVLSVYALMFVLTDFRWIRQINYVGLSAWWWLLYVVLFATLWAYMVESPISVIKGASLQSAALRPLVQGFTYISNLAWMPFVFLAFRQSDAFNRYMNAYAGAAIVALIACGLQLAAYASGQEFMPILRMTGNDSAIAAFTSGDSLVLRLYGFAGEPKSLGVFLFPLAIGMIVSVASSADRNTVRWWLNPVVVMAVLVTLLATFSSAVIIAFVVSLGLLLLAMPKKFKRIGRMLVLMIGTFALLTLVIGILSSSSTVGILGLLEERSFGRVSNELNERFETIALRYLFYDNLELAITGVGLGMYNFHLPGLHWVAGIEPIDSGWVTQMMDIGLIGVAIIASLIYQCYKLVQRANRFQDNVEVNVLAIAIATLLGTAILNSGINTFGSIMLWVGIVGALSNKNRFINNRLSLNGG